VGGDCDQRVDIVPAGFPRSPPVPVSARKQTISDRNSVRAIANSLARPITGMAERGSIKRT